MRVSHSDVLHGGLYGRFDEVEYGLEPHRIARLIKHIQNDKNGQYFLTTHSPTVLREFAIEDGELWRFATASLAHLSWPHLAGNLLAFTAAVALLRGFATPAATT